MQDNESEMEMTDKIGVSCKRHPLVPLREVLFFPNDMTTLFVGRKKSVCALQHAMEIDKSIVLVSQTNPAVSDPSCDDLCKVGTVAEILQIVKLPDNAFRVLVKIKYRCKIINLESDDKEVMLVDVEELKDDPFVMDDDMEALKRLITRRFEVYVQISRKVSSDVMMLVLQIEDLSFFVDAVMGQLEVKPKIKQRLLEMTDISEKLQHLYDILGAEISVLEAEERIRERVKDQVENTQKIYYLNEQLKAIQKELGSYSKNSNDNELSEVENLEQKIKKAGMSKEAKDKAVSECKKLKMMMPMSAEASVVRNYLEWLIAMPWGRKSKLHKDLKDAQQVLESNHYGISKIKERIIEHLAVQRRIKKIKGPILCLFGPPGVGKTSLARAIAEATGRKFVYISLGGVKDEAEIRGHRRTYIGSMPGKIIQGLKKVKASNPLVLLDEIDKVGSDFRGDPSSALLEVLDPEHNKYFVDHYLEVEFDLSEVMFITTANSLDIASPLLDRMEVIPIPGYTEDEKISIAYRYIIPSLFIDHGLISKEWSLSKDAMSLVIRNYTKESGVRNLKRELAKLIRKAVTEIYFSNKKKIQVNVNSLHKYLGVTKYTFGTAETEDLIGVVTGLAYTSYGGELLAIEAVSVPGEGKIKCTGKLGDVMKESAETAYSFVSSRSSILGIQHEKCMKENIHLHALQGAIPKDGPSAGTAMCTAIVSLLTGVPVKRSVAMTGEISLSGRVLPIGGLREKLLAASKGGVVTVIIPEKNRKDLEEIPSTIKKSLRIILVKTMFQVLLEALSSPLSGVVEERSLTI